MKLTMDGCRFGYWGGEPVLKGVSAAFEPGRVYGVIGPNGSGKSTLMKLLCGECAPDAGRVLLDGQDVRRLSSRRLARLMAVVPQKSDLAFDFAVADVVLMGRQPYIGRFGRESEDDLRLADEAMRMTGVHALRERPATLLSGGEWQRVLIARALCQDTPALLLDEPVSNLDIRHQLDILALARSRARERGALVVVVLHDLNLAAHFCDRLLLLSGGELVFAGAPADVLTAERLLQVYGVRTRITRTDGAFDVVPLFA